MKKSADRSDDDATVPGGAADGRDSPAVDELKIAIAQGRPVSRGRGEPAMQGHEWGKDRQVPADVLYDLLAGRGNTVKRRAAVLVGLRITGRLNLEAAELQVPLIAHNCFFDKPINLIGASAPVIRLSACVLPGIDAAELETRHGFDVSDSTLEIVDLSGAHVGGDLDLSGATLTGGLHPLDLGDGTLCPSETGPRTTKLALCADGLKIDQDMVCRRREGGKPFTADAEVRMFGARIGGELNFIGAQLSNANGWALSADQLVVGRGMFCSAAGDGQPFTATGEVRLLGAHIGGTLEFEGAQLTNDNGPALNADGLQVDQDMFCRVAEGGRPFTATGEIRLPGAHIRGQLDLSGAELHRSLTAINLEGAKVESLWLLFEERPEGVVDLRRLQANAIFDQPYGGYGSWPATLLEGCSYESLEASPPVDVATRLRWVRDNPEGYSPQPYEQLRYVLRRAGDEAGARRVAIEKQRRRRQELPLPAKVWSYILDAAVGYGYRTWRALAALLAIIGIGWWVFASASWDHLTAIKPQRPQFEPWLYSIDAVLPVISLGQESAWAPTGLFFEIWYVCSVVAGWVLGVGLIAALTAALFRE
jgi:hypothetical protein